MKIYEIVLCILGITFCHYVYIKSYSLIFGNKIQRIGIKSFVIFLLITVITYYNTFYNYDFTKIIISFLEIFLLLKCIYCEPIKITFLKTLIIYLIECVVEIIVGGLVFYMFFNSVQSFDQNIVIKVLFSILIMLIFLILVQAKVSSKIIKKMFDFMCGIFNITFMSIVFVISIAILAYCLIISASIYSYAITVVMIIILSILITISIAQSIKTKMVTDKQEVLLNFMKEYEMIIDKERIDRHEMVNNLLVLKSIKNKNTKQYDKILDDILLTYQSNKASKGLYELPSGLKGLFYYKIYDIKNKNIEVFINISNKIVKDLDSLDSKTLIKVCKILGILLDNAKEAACESKNKLVIIDLYKEEDNIVIYIENTIKENAKVDINKIKIKGFSTKGNNRGYGLYIVNKLLGESNRILLEQNIDKNKFISIMKIKNN